MKLTWNDIRVFASTYSSNLLDIMFIPSIAIYFIAYGNNIFGIVGIMLLFLWIMVIQKRVSGNETEQALKRILETR